MTLPRPVGKSSNGLADNAVAMPVREGRSLRLEPANLAFQLLRVRDVEVVGVLVGPDRTY